MPVRPVECDTPCAEAFSELANALQAAVLLVADLDRQLPEGLRRDEMARLRTALNRAVVATTRLALELRAEP